MQNEFRLTGKHVLICLLGFFAMVVTANMIFLNFAVRSFPGEQEKKSYLQGLHYNDRLVTRSKQAALGWQALIDEATLTAGQLTLTVKMSDKYGTALPGLKIDGSLLRPASAQNDHPLAFIYLGDGVYRASAPAAPGVWDVQAKSINADNDVFEFTSRLVLK